MLSFLAVNSTFRGPYSPGSALCLAFALASPGTATMSKVRGGLGTIADHLCALFERHGGELRRHAKVGRILVDGGAVRGVELGDGEAVTAPVVVSNLDPTATFTHLLDPDSLPDTSRVGCRPSTTGPPTSRRISRSAGCPNTGALRGPERGQLGRNVTFFGTAEQMQQDFEGCVRGMVPDAPSFNLQIPSLDDPSLAPAGKHAASSFAFYLPIGAGPRVPEPPARRDGRADRRPDRHGAPNFPDLVERQLNYPAYTYELMFGCTGGDFTHGLLQPEFMGPFRPGPRGWPDDPVPGRGPLSVRCRMPRRSSQRGERRPGRGCSSLPWWPG